MILQIFLILKILKNLKKMQMLSYKIINMIITLTLKQDFNSYMIFL